MISVIIIELYRLTLKIYKSSIYSSVFFVLNSLSVQYDSHNEVILTIIEFISSQGMEYFFSFFLVEWKVLDCLKYLLKYLNPTLLKKESFSSDSFWNNRHELISCLIYYTAYNITPVKCYFFVIYFSVLLLFFI